MPAGFQRKARKTGRKEVKPLAQETDETEVFPAETVAKMGKYGFMGIPVPKEYGGQGCDETLRSVKNPLVSV